MRQAVRTLLATGAAAFLIASGAGTAAAATSSAAADTAPNVAGPGLSGDTVQPRIVGGSQTGIGSAPYAAQIHVNSSGTSLNCTGSQISAQWVLTARHCEGTVSVRLGTAANGSGGVVRTVVQDVAWSGGDLRLLKLSSPYTNTYSKLSATKPATGNAATAFGWGRTGLNDPASSTLKTANVTVSGSSWDAFDGRAIQTRGVNGQVWKGDSGGPLTVGGRQVGVLSTGEAPNTSTTNPNHSRVANYASVAEGASWITATSGVAVN